MKTSHKWNLKEKTFHFTLAKWVRYLFHSSHYVDWQCHFIWHFRLEYKWWNSLVTEAMQSERNGNRVDYFSCFKTTLCLHSFTLLTVFVVIVVVFVLIRCFILIISTIKISKTTQINKVFGELAEICLNRNWRKYIDWPNTFTHIQNSIELFFYTSYNYSI